ncbi:UvrB/UvrC motif-containing protein [Halarsenatibacter silvermanii]|uniref:Protein-arginine kinase activator protein McsA n=1 Tax=Halarsenatibacter silvermanii TaxID=321763 RepID=A0A1G9SXD2_9FIRM|nr:UvrB/UvrC motif-containing protein [Halarsenatibacter silvermanii]SDM39987.1 Protein-arginine kinase activator protein McsA [Halarsenatibacter silvermanii]
MQCEKCGEREANVHMTKIVNNNKKEVHLCSQCAEKSGQISISGDPFSFQKMFSGFMQPDRSRSPSPREKLECDNCGLTYREFTEKGLFGCAECYDSFAEGVDYVVGRVQGGSEHRGKVPRRGDRKSRLEEKISSLRQDMEEAVDREDFERAAELRDKVKELESRMEAEDEK